MIQTTARIMEADSTATVTRLIQLLGEQRAHQVDVVAPSKDLSFKGGLLRIDSDAVVVDESGVTSVRGVYAPTEVFLSGAAARLDVPGAWLRKIHRERPDLFDQLLNGLLHGKTKRHADGSVEVLYAPDGRSHLIRAFSKDTDADENGLARALLSPNYRMIDHYDVVVAIMDGLNASGVRTEVREARVTEKQMVIRFNAPEIQVLAEELLTDYRSPYRRGNDGSYWISAGIRASNSETGDGRLIIAPEVTVLACTNGLTITRDVLAKTHLGGKMDDGVIQWSADTMQTNVDLIRKQVRDAVNTFLNVDYVKDAVRRLAEVAGVPIENAPETLQVVAKKFGYTEKQQADILNLYIAGGQTTAGGLMQAITALTQTVAEEDPDTASELEWDALAAMELAAGKKVAKYAALPS